MYQIWAIVQKDFRALFRDPYRLIYLLVAPLIMVFIASVALPSGNSNNPVFTVPVVQLDNGQAANDLVNELKKVKSIDWEMNYSSDNGKSLSMNQTEAEKLLPKRKAYVLIPQNFSEDIKNNKATSIKIIAGPSDQTVSMIVYRAINSIITPQSTVIVGQTVINEMVTQYTLELKKYRLGLNPTEIIKAATNQLTSSVKNPPLNVELENNKSTSNVKSSNPFEVYVPSFAVMFMLFGATTAAASLLNDREEGIIGRLRTMPIALSKVLLGKMISNFLLMFFQMSVLFISAKVLFGMSWGNDILAVILMIFSTSLASTGLGLLIASFSKSFSQVTAVMPVIILSMSAIGGSWWPLYMEPDIVQNFARVTVNAWSTEGFQKLFLYSGNLSNIWLDIVVLVAMGFVYITVASYNFQRKL